VSPPARRPWELLVVAAALVCFALATTLARAETTRLASTTFRGTWLCNWKVDGAFVPLAGARVERFAEGAHHPGEDASRRDPRRTRVRAP
jgi:hypothetical protein